MSLLCKRTVYDTPAGWIGHNYESGRKWARVIMTGGGAGGNFFHVNHAGGGGGAGGTVIMTFDITTPNATLNLGAGGATSTTGAGAAGTLTQFAPDAVNISYAEGGVNTADQFVYGGGNGGAIVAPAEGVVIRSGAGFGSRSKAIETDGASGESYWGGYPAPGAGGLGNDGVVSGGPYNGQDGIIIIEEYV